MAEKIAAELEGRALVALCGASKVPQVLDRPARWVTCSACVVLARRAGAGR